ncbi:protein-export chaperone SecB [Candidatus Pelagibacter sp.]|nr:protein-export chaperone SecB [Candidatus Pelagibacter sp.]|tara:strand:+ start:262 stop:684 length:423 start_codon:yes stop_codon:yes gene_type:complete
MTEKFKILAKYIKDMSSETPDVETYISTGNHLSKYVLDLDIRSIALKNKMIQIDITLKYLNKNTGVKKSHFEIVYSTVVKIDEAIKEKKDLEKIVLCDVPNAIYPDLEKSFLDMMHNSGHPSVKLEKKIDFTQLYLEKFN